MTHPEDGCFYRPTRRHTQKTAFFKLSSSLKNIYFLGCDAVNAAKPSGPAQNQNQTPNGILYCLYWVGGEEGALGLFNAVLECTCILHAKRMFIKASMWVSGPKCVKVTACKKKTLYFPVSTGEIVNSINSETRPDIIRRQRSVYFKCCCQVTT
jgi:hypothetical protein